MSDQALAIIGQTRPTFTDLSSKAVFVVNFDEEILHLKNLVAAQPELLRCTPESLRAAFLQVASVGLSLNPARQHATIVPRRKRKKQNGQWVDLPPEATYLLMYRGLLSLAKRYSGITTIVCENVYQKDTFSLRQGTSPNIDHVVDTHSPRGGQDNPYVGTYVAAWLKDSAVPKIEWVPADEMFVIRSKSESYKPDSTSSPWVVFEGEMFKKSALKRAQKTWLEDRDDESALRLREIIHQDNLADRRDEAIDGEASEVLLITEGDRAELLSKMKAAKVPEAKLCEMYSIETLAQLPKEKLNEVVARLDTRAAEVAKRAGDKKDGKKS